MFLKERLTVILALLSCSVFGEAKMLTIPTSPAALNSLNDGEVVSAIGPPLEYLVSPRIVDGRNADDGQFPHQISLRQGGSHICGGSIISPLYVVTAAHCVILQTRDIIPASHLSIRAGSKFANSGGYVTQVSEVILRPPGEHLKYDIALLKLSASLAFSKRVQAVPLALEDPQEYSSIVISGWGRLSTNNANTPNHLQFITLWSLSSERCRQAIGDRGGSVICLGHVPGKGSCFGDSGGPAIDEKGRLVGVASFVRGYCGSDSPDGYVSISFHRDWIIENSDVTQ